MEVTDTRFLNMIESIAAEYWKRTHKNETYENNTISEV
jgi:hypothetical protein